MEITTINRSQQVYGAPAVTAVNDVETANPNFTTSWISEDHVTHAKQEPDVSSATTGTLIQWTLKQTLHMIIIYTVVYSIVFLLGVLGNGLVVWVVYSNRRMHNVTNYFIVNLALADILVCVLCLPITLLQNLFSGWHYGAFMCKATPFLQGVSVSASVNTLMAIAIDRYLAICHGMKCHVTGQAARLIIFLIWLFAASIISPWAVYYQQDISQASESSDLPIQYICSQRWPSRHMESIYFLLAIFVTCYTIPLICVSVCYALIGYRVCNRNAPGLDETSGSRSGGVAGSRGGVIYKSKVKVVKMLVVVVVVFAFSWLPLYVVHLWLLFGSEPENGGVVFEWLVQVIIPVIQWCGSANSCVNPIIYCFFSRKFREGFAEVVHCRCVAVEGSMGGGRGRDASKSYGDSCSSFHPPSKSYVYRFNCGNESAGEADDGGKRGTQGWGGRGNGGGRGGARLRDGFFSSSGPRGVEHGRGGGEGRGDGRGFGGRGGVGGGVGGPCGGGGVNKGMPRERETTHIEFIDDDLTVDENTSF